MQVVLGFPAHRLLGLSCSLCHPFVRCIWEVSSNWNSLILCTGSDAHSGRICAYFCGASFNKSEEEVSTYICGQSNKHFLFPVFWCGTTIIQDYPRLSKIIQDHPRSSKIIQDHPNSSKILCSGVAGGEEWLEAVGIVRGLYCHHLSRSLRHFDIFSCGQSLW